MKKQRLLLIGALPLLGFGAFYLVPLGMTVYYALVNSAFDDRFAGLGNFSYVMSNQYFQTGMKNLSLLGGGMILAALLASLVIAPLLYRHPKLAGLGMAVLLLPLLIPSVSAVSLWSSVFDTRSTLASASSQAALITLYLWKYAGVGAVLLYTALQKIPQAMTDAAALDGAGAVRTYFSIRLPMAGEQLAGVLIFLTMFMFRCYKESYLLFGDYPSTRVYMLQHYMNHQYVKMNFQYVAACAVLLAVFALILYGAAFLIMKRRRLA